jgi:hypothetical protein
MATNYPTALDSLTNPASTDLMSAAGVNHADQHANSNDAIEALQVKVGINSSADVTSHDRRIALLEAGGTGGGFTNVFLLMGA